MIKEIVLCEMDTADIFCILQEEWKSLEIHASTDSGLAVLLLTLFLETVLCIHFASKQTRA